jgi:DNA-binding NarL/FixJ family response regulator
MIRILLADDHRILRDALRRLLDAEGDLHVCGEATDGDEAVRMVNELAPDLLLLDVSMPRTDGLEALRVLSEDGRLPRTLLLTAAIGRDAFVTAMQLGARGVVMKDAPAATLLKAIRGVVAGELWIGRERVENLLEALRPRNNARPSSPGRDYGLTVRELLVVAGVVAAFPNREIAQRLDISEKTVKNHLTNIFDKLGVSTRMELAMFALKHALPMPDFPPR